MSLSPNAIRWLEGLDMAARPIAREWIAMDPQEAQGRTAIGMIELRSEMHTIRDEILAAIEQRRESPWKAIAKGSAAAGAGLVTGVAAAIKAMT